MNTVNTTLINDIKKNFFSLRNGIVADSLRRLYPEGKIIFGLTMPEFTILSQKYGKNLELGKELWQDKKTRESRLFALYIIPVNELIYKEIKDMALDIESLEEAELLAFKILRNHISAKALYTDLQNIQDTKPAFQHLLEMFKKNLDQI